ncbi:hypothetical protein EEK40_23220 [Salmonella enterica]|nr:hypothetical protein [Salmonella enterica]ECA5507499.1 hypothetical protein [Salmonella enterica subsp. enterica serovar Saintpaul]EAQ0500088.1 hypothetical protein [Salmonella enterica]EAT7400218.1 hypothetical protein [Salmonella enterica]EAU3904630.1 hypothetical protein [Salmonella enterica]
MPDGGVTPYLAYVSGAVCRPDKRSASGKTRTCDRFESSILQIAKRRRQRPLLHWWVVQDDSASPRPSGRC